MGEGAFDDIARFSSPPIFVALLFGERPIAISAMKDPVLVAEHCGGFLAGVGAVGIDFLFIAREQFREHLGVVDIARRIGKLLNHSIGIRHGMKFITISHRLLPIAAGLDIISRFGVLGVLALAVLLRPRTGRLDDSGVHRYLLTFENVILSF